MRYILKYLYSEKNSHEESISTEISKYSSAEILKAVNLSFSLKAVWLQSCLDRQTGEETRIMSVIRLRRYSVVP